MPILVDIFSDSRGKRLENDIAEYVVDDSVHICVHSKSGDRLQNITARAKQWAMQNRTDLLVVYGGTCDLTMKHKREGVITPKYTTADSLLGHLTEQFNYVKVTVGALHNAPPLLIVPLSGVNLSACNPPGYPVTAEEQTMINTAVLDVNSHITKLNATDAVVTPWTASLTHVRQHGGHYKHDYRQYPDGVHASRTLEKRIAKVMARGILGTLRNYNVLPPK